MTETPNEPESAPIETQTRVPPDEPVEEADADEKPEAAPIATSTRTP